MQQEITVRHAGREVTFPVTLGDSWHSHVQEYGERAALHLLHQGTLEAYRRKARAFLAKEEDTAVIQDALANWTPGDDLPATQAERLLAEYRRLSDTERREYLAGLRRLKEGDG